MAIKSPYKLELEKRKLTEKKALFKLKTKTTKTDKNKTGSINTIENEEKDLFLSVK